MTAMQELGPGADTPLPADVGAPGAASPDAARLREARESTGLARDEFARRAHIPAGVLADLEAGRFDRLGATVFVRGYLRSYARAAGLPDDAFAGLLPASDETPPLVAQRIAPATPRWVSRYATPVAYALLTGVVMVPLVYLARPTVQQVAQAPSLTPIDAAGVARAPGARLDAGLGDDLRLATASPSTTASDDFVGPPAPSPGLARAAAPTPAAPAPVMASLAPLPQVAEPVLPRRVTLRLEDDSWVEFTGADGRRLEYALLPAGTVRDYQLQGSAVLMIGNAGAARLTVDGRAVDLRPYSSENDVARVRLGDGVSPASD